MGYVGGFIYGMNIVLLIGYIDGLYKFGRGLTELGLYLLMASD